MTASQETSNPTEALRKAILKSGYVLEMQTAHELRQQEFRVKTNPHYRDFDGKPREIDLIASYAKGFRIGRRREIWLCPTLVIECKKTPAPIVLLTTQVPDDQDRWETLKMVCHSVQGADELSSNWSWLASRLDLQEFHHYATPRVATQYCFLEGKVVHHTEEGWKAVSSVIGATAYQMRTAYETLPRPTTSLNLEVFYPVIVLNSSIYEARLEPGAQDGLQLEPSDHLQYRHTEIRGVRREEFQIDVVTPSYFPQYLKEVLQDSARMADSIHRNYSLVRDMIAARHIAARGATMSP